MSQLRYKSESNSAFMKGEILDIGALRKEFPILQRIVNGKPLVYLDNGATTQKPQQVITAVKKFYSNENSNIHRGVHSLSQEATAAYEEAREKVRHFINADAVEEIIFTRGATESINLVANTFGKKYVGKGDEIVISTLEHHSNIVPWQMLCEEKGAILRVVPILDSGEFNFEEFEKLLNSKTKLISVLQVSNALGVITPIADIVEKAHENGIPVLVDGSQAIQHMEVDVRALDCDFYVFSGHKMYGPTGIGVLYGKANILNDIPPYQGGGDMIKTVTFAKTTYNDIPFKFEAGTPNISGAIGLGAAIDFIEDLGIDLIAEHEAELLRYATVSLSKMLGMKIYGTTADKASVISFLVGDVHPYDMGVILDKLGVAIRTGHHCAQPLMDRLGIPGTVRASFAVYNTKEEIDLLVDAVNRTRKMFI